jgi:hypothetical protein
MTGFELEALRRLLFFSPPEAALMVSNTSEQAWRRWESGARKVPDDVAKRMTSLIEWRQAAIDATVKQISAAPKEVSIALVWYDSLDDWATLPGREPALWRPQQSVCAAVFSELPGRVSLVRFDAPAYSAWLGGKNDGETARSTWAAEQIHNR